MECVGVLAASAAFIFAKLAAIQDLNPVVWGALALVIYAGAPAFMIYRGSGWMDAPWVWASSFGGLFLLFVAQCLVVARQRSRNR